ncbi:MAG: DUF3772 domain-containing protein [Hyphomicrobiaceae bacterium]|nr:DUF3772 domain-containing protein [Hyphomicrobiaceae bacterium]
MPSRFSRLFLSALVCAGALGLTIARPLDAPAAENGDRTTPAAAQPATTAPPSLVFPEDLAQGVARVAAAIETAEKAVERVKDREAGLAAQRTEIERIEIDSEQVIAELQPRLAAVVAQLEKLGPPPEKDAAPEAPSIANERARLSAVQAEIAGAIKTAELTRVRSRQLIGRVQELRQAIFARDLLLRSGNPLAASTWRRLAEELPRAGRQVATIAVGWWEMARGQSVALMLVLAVAVGANAAARWSIRRLGYRLSSVGHEFSGFFPRAGRACWMAASLALPPLATAVVLYGGLAALDLLTLTAGQFADSALQAFIIFAAISALARAALAPCPPDLPLVDIADASAPKLLRLIKGLAAVLALDLLLSDVVRMLYLPLEVGVAQASLTSIALAVLLAAFVRTPLATRAAALVEPPARLSPRWLKLPLAGLALAIVATTLLGYVALGRFIATQLMLAGGAALILLLAHVGIRHAASVLADGGRPVGRLLEAKLGLDHERTGYVTRSLVFLLEVVLLLAALPLVLLTWGYSRDDIVDWLKLGIFGFEIGQFQISLARILLAAVFFLALLFGTRFVQRWLDRSVLEPARVDRAISHSVLMGVGYAGVGLATIVALSYAGLDFTQLAIVAGALSLGIGFGLQAIFNNFVSGIILLVERPIKVGDWIVVNGQEGFVRRINVRATEIETFDRASLIIPNSELITGSVTNWTHRNLIGRLIVRVGVSYRADPEQVLGILLRVADQSTSLLKEPRPVAMFDDFGDSALLFSLYAFVPDIGRRGAAQSELRVAIFKALREAGIEIPFPQHDVHLRDLDGVRQVFAQALEARRREKEVEAGDA